MHEELLLMEARTLFLPKFFNSWHSKPSLMIGRINCCLLPTTRTSRRTSYRYRAMWRSWSTMCPPTLTFRISGGWRRSRR
ncbi:unnamed protein product, partial [Rhizoctonia solani]